MITLFYRDTLVFIFLVKMTVSLKYFKHYRLATHKVHHQVFPSAIDGESYTVYIAGKVFTIDVPSYVEKDPYKIANWKVFNSNPNRLMFISEGEAFIMIDQTTKKKIVFPNENIGSIIVLGNNEALHMPTIVNPYKTSPKFTWNYLELLYFNEKEGTIKIIESIPWYDQNDWQYILEWKMLDYITIDTKMYILADRKLVANETWNDGEPIQDEIFIIRLNLNVDRSLLSTAVELHKRVRFGSSFAKFLTLLKANENDLRRFSILIQRNSYNKTFLRRVFLPKLNARFEAVKGCKTSASCTSIYHHLRLKSCTDLTCVIHSELYHTGGLEFAPKSSKNLAMSAPFRTYHGGYPDAYYSLIYFNERHELFTCVLRSETRFDCIKNDAFGGTDFIADLVLNVINGKTFFFNNSNPIKPSPVSHEYPCFRFENCLDCIMYGFTIGCIWSDFSCKQRSPTQVYSHKEFTVNLCIKIVAFSLGPYKELSKKLLEIEFSDVFSKRRIKPSIFVGPDNDCVETERSLSKLTCLLSFNSPGEFPIRVKFSSVAYSDTTPIIAISNDKIFIESIKTNLWIKFAVVMFFVIVALILLTVVIFIYLQKPVVPFKWIEYSKSFTSRPGDRTTSSADSGVQEFKSDSISTIISTRKAPVKQRNYFK